MEIINNIDQDLVKQIRKENDIIKPNTRKVKRMKIIIPIVAILFAIFMLMTILASDSALFKIRKKQETINKLESQFATIKRQNEQLRTRILNSNNLDFYFEKQARSLGMKKPGEVIINLRNRNKYIEIANKYIEKYEQRKRISFEQFKKSVKMSRIAISVIFGIIFLYIIYRYFALRTGNIKVPDFFGNKEQEEV